MSRWVDFCNEEFYLSKKHLVYCALGKEKKFGLPNTKEKPLPVISKTKI